MTTAPRPLPNRVTPFGDIVAIPARGTLMGNRGRLHDEEQRLVRRVAPGYRAWVTCLLAFKGRRRAVMSPGRYTELFFLDEATALAAGHRPCGECRRPDYLRFKRAWVAGNPEHALSPTSPIARLDRLLHADRLALEGVPRTHREALGRLPDGVLVATGPPGAAFLLWRGALHRWSVEGYGPPPPGVPSGEVDVLTPRTIVNALRAGYTPRPHPSAGGSSRL